MSKLNVPSFLFFCVNSLLIVDIIAQQSTNLTATNNKWISYGHNLYGDGVILEKNKIQVINFTYDGLSPDAHFYVGSFDYSSNSGVLINFEDESDRPLRAFNAENFFLELPESINPSELQWLAVRCGLDNETIGYIYFQEKQQLIKGLTDKIQFVQLEPFTSDSFGFRSGPVLLVNEGTFFVTNFVYNGKAPDAHFWVGNVTKGEDDFGILLLDEYQTNDTLGEYKGKDFYITLPTYLKARDYKYFGVWSQVAKRNVGFTEIPEDLPKLMENNGQHEYDNDHKYIARLAKCCPENEVKTVAGCKPKERRLSIPIDIHEGNLTKFNDEPLTDVNYVRYTYKLNCEHNMYHLDKKDKFYLLTHGVLLFDSGDVMTKDKFCIDYYNSNEEESDSAESKDSKDIEVWVETVFICFPEAQIPEFVQDIYVACIYISAIFLFLTTLIFLRIEDTRDARGFNVLGYSLFMSVSFALLATVRLLRVQEETCINLGYVYQFFIVSSFMWLFFLTFETYHRIMYIREEYSKGRYYVYAGLAVGIPFLGVIISLLIKDSIPELDNKFSTPDPCWFRSSKKVIFYYVPIMFSIILNSIFCLITWIKIKQNDKENHIFWIQAKNNLKNVFRSCYLQLSVMTLCWTVEIFSFFFETVHGFWIAVEIINSLQGLFVFIIFILHDPVIEILKDIYKHRIKKIDDNTEDLFIKGDKPRPPSMHLKTLTAIDHAESIEDLCANSYNESR